MLKSKSVNPKDAVIAVTYRCNSKCSMCNIWKENPVNELEPNDFSNLPNSLKDINITGGEPFLRDDLAEIIQVITNNNPKVRLVFSSNGFLTDKIVNTMLEIKKINSNSAIGISIDGINEMHDEIRGVNKAFEKTINTIISLKRAGIKDIRIGFTASNQNIKHLSDVYNLTRELDIEFTLSVVHNSEGYFGIETNMLPDKAELEKEIRYVLKKEIKFSDPRRLFRIYFMKGIIDYVNDGIRPLSCYALKDFFFMDAQGNIYPCNMINKSFGNIKEKIFKEIWDSPEAEIARNIYKNCHDCWMVCSVKSSIRREFFKASRTIIPAKLNPAKLLYMLLT